MPYSIRDIAREIKAEVIGESDSILTEVADLDDAGPQSLSFAVSGPYIKLLKNTRAGAVIVSQKHADQCPSTVLISDNPYLSFARAARILHPEKSFPPGIHPTAQVHEQCQIAENVYIGPNVVISEKCTFEAGVCIGAGSVITAPVSFGEGSRLIARVTIVGPTIIGKRAIIHPGVVLASDGFGLTDNQGVWEKIPQLGRVVLGDDVEIGANTAIDRGAIKDTIIGNGVKLDNQIQIAHNVVIGDHTAIAGCVGIAGSTVIGKHCAIGAASGIKGHITLADGVQISGMSTVRQSIDKPGMYSSGTTLLDINSWLRNATRFKEIDNIYKRVNQMAKKLDDLDKGK